MIHCIRILTYFDEKASPFNTKYILEKVCEAFPDAKVDKEDPYISRAKYFEEQLKKVGLQDNIVVKKAWADVKVFGPAFSFTISLNNIEIWGKVDRFCVEFLSKSSISEKARNYIYNFLNSLNLGEIEEIISDDKDDSRSVH